MTAETLAAALLRDVKRYSLNMLAIEMYETPHGGWVKLPAVEAALSRTLDPALSERVGRIVDDWEEQASERDPRDPTKEQIYREAADIRALLAQNAALRAERDEADRRAGAAERELADKRDTIGKVSRVRDEMKKQRGYDYTVSFDRVWKETCEKADRAEAAEAKVEKLRGALREIAERPSKMTWGEEYEVRAAMHDMGEFARAAITTEADNG